MFGSLGVPEILFILVVALLVFGPRRLPEIGRTVGKALGEFRRATTDLKRSIDTEVTLEEVRRTPPASPVAPAAAVPVAPSAAPEAPGEPAADPAIAANAPAPKPVEPAGPSAPDATPVEPAGPAAPAATPGEPAAPAAGDRDASD